MFQGRDSVFETKVLVGHGRRSPLPYLFSYINRFSEPPYCHRNTTGHCRLNRQSMPSLTQERPLIYFWTSNRKEAKNKTCETQIHDQTHSCDEDTRYPSKSILLLHSHRTNVWDSRFLSFYHAVIIIVFKNMLAIGGGFCLVLLILYFIRLLLHEFLHLSPNKTSASGASSTLSGPRSRSLRGFAKPITKHGKVSGSLGLIPEEENISKHQISKDRKHPTHCLPESKTLKQLWLKECSGGKIVLSLKGAELRLNN